MINYIDKIKMEEGDKAVMYKCTAGKWTIGAGINLEAQEMPQRVRDLWLSIIVESLEYDLQARFLRDTVMNFYGFRADVKLVLMDMAYQMGITGLFKFKNMLSAIKEGDYSRAADELLDSNYARQTQNRANRNADLLRGAK